MFDILPKYVVEDFLHFFTLHSGLLIASDRNSALTKENALGYITQRYKNLAGLIHGLTRSARICFSLTLSTPFILASFSVRLYPQCSSSLTQIRKFSISQSKSRPLMSSSIFKKGLQLAVLGYTHNLVHPLREETSQMERKYPASGKKDRGCLQDGK